MRRAFLRGCSITCARRGIANFRPHFFRMIDFSLLQKLITAVGDFCKKSDGAEVKVLSICDF